MQIKLNEIKIRDIVDGYKDSDENGVVAYGGKLNVRPAFQREFVYNEKKRNAVIDTVMNNFPLNVMYWVKSGDDTYELLDGQQRTLSLCRYINGDFSVNSRGFDNLTATEKNQILNYKLMIYICEGNDRETLDWFKIINIAGEPLRDQEMRNAIYTGQWLYHAKKYFSKIGCPAYCQASKYLTGEVNRQEYLATALTWISARDNIKVEDYMAAHQHDTHAAPLWQYFQSVISWTTTIFPKYRKEMKGLPWGIFYNKYHENTYDPNKFEERISLLMQDDDVTKRSGIYEYLLSNNEKHLNIRAFTDNEKRQVYERQKGICPHCVAEHRQKIHHEMEEMEADHIKPWHDGGKTNVENCQLLCKEHNRAKSGK